MSQDSPLLEVEDLHVQFRTGRETVRAVNGASFSVRAGEVMAVLGESGSGKSVAATTIMRLLQSPPGFVTGGQVRFNGTDILRLPSEQWRGMLGANLGMVLQDALTALNPVFPIGKQIAEVFRVHGESRSVANRRALDLLERVGIPDPVLRARDYPHQFSGGMRQRVMIAMAIALRPQLLIADEPTTALDVTVQAQIMELLRSISREDGMAVLLITHDIGVVMDYADRVSVMYAGRVVEYGPVREVLEAPSHPYTLALLESAPQARRKGSSLSPIVGSPPDMARPPSGCAFHPRCRFATAICREAPPPRSLSAGRMSECHHSETLYARAAV
ncbi:MAG TPA: ABC transporter ATP-binding protein [Devosia sp.]|nr:ABC transporter ATP-binding protein [Devosia sp.]